MTGPEHYREAERCLQEAFACQHPEQDYLSDWNQQRAQVHATLALVAATMTGVFALTPADGHEWRKALDPEYAAEVTR